jgi:hypothetical protein
MLNLINHQGNANLNQNEVVGNIMEHVVIGNDFPNRTPMAQQIRERMNK